MRKKLILSLLKPGIKYDINNFFISCGSGSAAGYKIKQKEIYEFKDCYINLRIGMHVCCSKAERAVLKFYFSGRLLRCALLISTSQNKLFFSLSSIKYFYINSAVIVKS
jgi:hypothetical protein